ncbi:hypothetical protein VTK73DRAFT_4112 [Phialemonium thermophilum]|uniref:C2H2-type domain-containing protein n=1 Tax=Phialemonium thermophilum TaxID=223376 RepID=A0ABR3VBM3_9PEZI
MNLQREEKKRVDLFVQHRSVRRPHSRSCRVKTSTSFFSFRSVKPTVEAGTPPESFTQLQVSACTFVSPASLSSFTEPILRPDWLGCLSFVLACVFLRGLPPTLSSPSFDPPTYSTICFLCELAVCFLPLCSRGILGFLVLWASSPIGCASCFTHNPKNLRHDRESLHTQREEPVACSPGDSCCSSRPILSVRLCRSLEFPKAKKKRGRAQHVPVQDPPPYRPLLSTTYFSLAATRQTYFCPAV